MRYQMIISGNKNYVVISVFCWHVCNFATQVLASQFNEFWVILDGEAETFCDGLSTNFKVLYSVDFYYISEQTAQQNL